MKTLVLSLFALFAFASADVLTIVNNCPGDFEFAYNFSPVPGTAQCDGAHQLLNGQTYEYDYPPGASIVIKNADAESTENFEYKENLSDFISDVEVDIGCADLVNSGFVETFTPKSLYLELCGPKSPEPQTPLEDPVDIRIMNTCDTTQTFHFMRYVDERVFCETKTLNVGDYIDKKWVYDKDLLVAVGDTSSFSNNRDIYYANNLPKAIYGTTDVEGSNCHELAENGGAVYSLREADSVLELCLPGPQKPEPTPPTEDPKPTPTPTEDPKPTPTPTEDPKPTPIPEKPSSPPSKTPSPPSKTSDDSSSGISIGIIIGAAVGGVALIVGVIVACVCIKKRKKNRQDPVLDTVSHDTFVVPIVSSYVSHPAPARPVVDQVISGNDHQIVNIV